jgi:hypothetical protein
MSVGRGSAFAGGLDRVGVVLSSVCALHCAVMPAIAGFLPLMGLSESIPETLESVVLLTSVATAIASLTGGCRHHRQWRPWGFLLGGLSLIGAGRLLVEEVPWLEIAFVMSGALLLATAHLINWRLCCASRARVGG